MVFDLDGTLCNINHRLHYIQQEKKDWDSFFEACDSDSPRMPIVRLCRSLAMFNMVIYVTGRRESTRKKTLDWLKLWNLPCDPNGLYMRGDGDYRPDHIIKPELVGNLLRKIDIVFEDRTAVVEAWRKLGITCLQVTDGDF